MLDIFKDRNVEIEVIEKCVGGWLICNKELPLKLISWRCTKYSKVDLGNASKVLYDKSRPWKCHVIVYVHKIGNILPMIGDGNPFFSTRGPLKTSLESVTSKF